MSLLRLLTTGKSLVGVSDVENRYRVTRERLLPHFGTARNPFTSTRTSEPAPAERRLSANCGAGGVSGGGGGVQSASGEPSAATGREHPDHLTVFAPLNRKANAAPSPLEKRRGGIVDRLSVNRGSEAGALRLKAVSLMTGWKARIGGLLPGPRSKAVKPVVPRFAKLPVQGELSLDKIQVVRNDLRDADLEVVPAKAPAGRATQEGSDAKRALGRVTARILGVHKP